MIEKLHFSPVQQGQNVAFNLAQRVGFEPTDGINLQTISNRSRYSHFDTAAFLFPTYCLFVITNRQYEEKS